MQLFDFIKDHLVNIDGVFDKHQNGDDQKPHKQPLLHHQQLLVFYSEINTVIFVDSFISTREPVLLRAGNTYHSDYIFNVFRPPIV